MFGDFNSDGIVGFPIADTNGDGLVDGTNKYQIFNQWLGHYSVTCHGKTFSDSANPNWNVIKAVSSGSGYKLFSKEPEPRTLGTS